MLTYPHTHTFIHTLYTDKCERASSSHVHVKEGCVDRVHCAQCGCCLPCGRHSILPCHQACHWLHTQNKHTHIEHKYPCNACQFRLQRWNPAKHAQRLGTKGQCNAKNPQPASQRPPTHTHVHTLTLTHTRLHNRHTPTTYSGRALLFVVLNFDALYSATVPSSQPATIAPNGRVSDRGAHAPSTDTLPRGSTETCESGSLPD